MKKAFVSGATGFLGSHLVERLVKEDYKVTCMVRRTSNLQYLEGLPVDFVYADISGDFNEALPQIKEANYIFHLAGVVFTNNTEDFYRINGEAAGRFARFCCENCNDLKRFVLVSSLAALGSGIGSEPATDLNEPNPMSEYGKSKRQGEIELFKLADKMPVTAIRPPPVFGPRDKGVLFFFQLAEKRLKPILGFGERTFALVYVDNIIDGIMLAAVNEDAPGKAFLLGDGENPDIDTVFAYLQQVIGRKTFSLFLPDSLLLVSGLGANIISKVIGKPLNFGYDKAKELVHRNWAVNDELARDVLGYKPRISIQKGIELTYNWYKQQKWL